MNVALFVPCYIDQLFPEIGWASVAVLERNGCTVCYEPAQTCCGQVLLNSGAPDAARPLARRFLELFARADHVVVPSASCATTVRRHYAHLLPGDPRTADLSRVRELCEFLVDVLGLASVPGRFAHRVGLHPSCHGLRELGLGTASERNEPEGTRGDPARQLLASLEGLELVEPARADECCGFGGSFAVGESAVSERMGRDRVRAHVAAGAEVLTATDVSCLAHLAGIARRTGEPLRLLHVAEILAEAGA